MLKKVILSFACLGIVFLNAQNIDENIDKNTQNQNQQNKKTNNYYSKIMKILDYIENVVPKITEPKKLNIIIDYTNKIIDNLKMNTKNLTKEEKKQILIKIKKIVSETKNQKQKILNFVNGG